MKKFLKKEYVMPILAIVLAIAVVTGVSYAIFQVTTTGTENNVINAGTLQLTFDESSSNEISLTDAVPLTDATGMQGTPYTFTITNTGTLDAQYRLMIEENDELYASHGDEDRIFPNRKLKIGLTKNGQTTYISYDRSSLDSGILAPKESVTYTARIWIDYNAGNEVQGNHFHGHFTVEAIQENDIFSGAAKTILANNTVQTTTPNFATATGTGLFQAPDDYGTSYYFRGNVTNNYLSFAGKQWRIIRINGDGTIRIISTDPDSTSYVQSSTADDSVYAGYKYTIGEQHGTSTDGFLKTAADNWYRSNLIGYENYLADSIFCNDRTTTGDNTEVTYSSYTRLVTNAAPILTCPDKRDAFTVNDTVNGNGALDYPIGYITADEALMAGANMKSYLPYFESTIWTMTPAGDGLEGAEMFCYTSNPSLPTRLLTTSVQTATVVNLRADVQLTGTGTASDPYEIVES